MSLTWMRISLDLPDHPKFLVLKRAIGPEAMEALLRVWRFAVRGRRDGRFRDADEVELAAEWRGVTGALHSGMIRAGFLDADGLTLHDWMHHNGRALVQIEHRREQTAERVRRYREREGLSPAPPPVPPPPTTTTTTTATATGDALRTTLRNALPESALSHGMTDDRSARGQPPPGADQRLAVSFREYQMSAGPDGYAAFCRWVRTAEEAGTTMKAILAWCAENRGRHIYEARDALVAPPARPKVERPPGAGPADGPLPGQGRVKQTDFGRFPCSAHPGSVHTTRGAFSRCCGAREKQSTTPEHKGTNRRDIESVAG